MLMIDDKVSCPLVEIEAKIKRETIEGRSSTS
jgi:hypothetical protein